MRIFTMLALLLDAVGKGFSLKCFTCASAEYEPLYEHFTAFRRSLSTPRFGQLCDHIELLQALAPVEQCPTTCISLMEPQYFGGVQSYSTPYTYIRGCASTLFAGVERHAPEVNFLHSEAICLRLSLTQIWPSIQTDEHVEVCSCTTDGCNTDIATSGDSGTTNKHSPELIIYLIAVLFAALYNLGIL